MLFISISVVISVDVNLTHFKVSKTSRSHYFVGLALLCSTCTYRVPFLLLQSSR